MNIDDLVNLLAAHRTLGAAPRKELEWIASHGTLTHFKVGEIVARQTEVIDGLKIVLSGRVTLYADRPGSRQKLMEWSGGEVTGLLPYSRTQKPPGDTIVEEEGNVLTIFREDLPDLIHNCKEVTAILVHVMVDRARRFTTADLRDEKLVSLGKLAAGVAHELNNPASAAIRDAKSIRTAIASAEDAAHALGVAGLTPQQLAELETVRRLCSSHSETHVRSPLEIADREDAIDAWLSAHGVDTSLAADLAATEVSIDDLKRLSQSMQGNALQAALAWIVGGCAARMLATNIELAASRIHSLVMSLKGFTHMDRALTLEPVDVRRGLSDAVSLLEGKAKRKQIKISLITPSNLPPVVAVNAEINQVWMNLIDNAVDAVESKGNVTVTAQRDDKYVTVSVVDDGEGIPNEIRDRIFDPFFTTKPIGEGTGLGLDIVRRAVQSHSGLIDVQSQPGRTEFRVSLKIAAGHA